MWFIRGGLFFTGSGDLSAGIAREGPKDMYHDLSRMPANEIVNGYLKPMKVLIIVGRATGHFVKD